MQSCCSLDGHRRRIPGCDHRRDTEIAGDADLGHHRENIGQIERSTIGHHGGDTLARQDDRGTRHQIDGSVDGLVARLIARLVDGLVARLIDGPGSARRGRHIGDQERRCDHRSGRDEHPRRPRSPVGSRELQTTYRGCHDEDRTSRTEILDPHRDRCANDMLERTTHLFAYGTLLPGDVRWPLLAAFVVDDGWPDEVAGTLYDTGLGYPAAVFTHDALVTAPEDQPLADTGQSRYAGIIRGRSFVLLDTSLDHALSVLDDEEDTVAGLYRRVLVRTATTTAWAYAYGTGLQLEPIPSGDWLDHRRTLPRSDHTGHHTGHHTERPETYR